MNKLITFDDNSYMPLWQKDIAFLQEAFRMPLVKLCETLLGKTSGIICGCKFTPQGGNTIGSSITEGLVLMDGEIIYCPADMVFFETSHLGKVVAYDENGDKIFKVDNSTEVRRTYYTPIAKLINNFTIGGKTIALNDEGKKNLIECLFDVLYEKGVEKLFNGEIITYTQNGNNEQGSTVNISYKKVGKEVFVVALTGRAGGTDEGGGSDIGGAMNRTIPFTFPEGFRPALTTFFSYHKNSDMNDVSLGRVDPDGKIYVRHRTVITAIAFNFLIE